MRVHFQRLTVFRGFKTRLAAALFCLAFMQPALQARAEEFAAAAPYNEGMQFFFEQEYAQAITQLSAAATPGAPWLRDSDELIPNTQAGYAAEAACMLGDLHALGLGTPRDMRIAGKWWFTPEKQHGALLAAAEKGDAHAQSALADLYLTLPCRMHIDPRNRLQITSDSPLMRNQAIEWYGKASASGDKNAALKAANILTKIYNKSPQELRDMQGWYRDAANAGMAEGQYRYGLALRDDGEYAEGLRWIRMAEAQGYAPAKKYLEVGRGNELRSSGRFEMVAVLVAMAALTVTLSIVRKKQPLRAYLTRRYALKVVIYIVIFAVSLQTIAATPELSRIFDRIFMWLMHARTYLPDAIADNVYIFVIAVFLALIAFVLLVAQFKEVFFSSVMRAMDTEPERKKPADDKKPE